MPGTEIETKSILAHIEKIEGATGEFSAIASTGAVDRDGEIIEPSAFKATIPEFMKNPVLVAGHTYSGFSGEATVIGSVKEMKAGKDAVRFKAQWASTPLAADYRSLYEEGHMKAFSVGFIPREAETNEVDGKNVRTYTEVELLEISAVAVPSNRQALIDAAAAGNRAARANGENEIIKRLGNLEELVRGHDDVAAEIRTTLGKVEDAITEFENVVTDPERAYSRGVGLLDDDGLEDDDNGADSKGHIATDEDATRQAEGELTLAVRELTKQIREGKKNV